MAARIMRSHGGRIEKIIRPTLSLSREPLPLEIHLVSFPSSLVAALLWSCAGGIVYQFVVRPSRRQASFVIGLAVFSHWVVDLIVHRPDLPLYGNSAKVGLGLWNAPALAFGLEAALLLGGMWVYLRGRLARSLGTLVFGVLMLGIQAYISSVRPRHPIARRRRPRSSRTPFSPL